MHYLDELLALYQTRDVHAQRYLISTVGGLPAGSDAGKLVEFLWEAGGSRNALLRHQSRFELGRIIGTCLRRRFSLLAADTGIWSRYARRRGASTTRSEQGSPSVQPIDPALGAAALEILQPTLAKALDHMESRSAHTRWAASLVIGQSRSRSIIEGLVGRARGKQARFGHAAALADIGTIESLATLRQVIEAFARTQPDVLLLAGALGTGDAVAILERMADETDDGGRAGIARALGGLAPEATRGLLDRLIRRREGWVTAYALDSLATAALAGDLALVEHADRLESHEFIHVLAARTAGFVPTPDAKSFLCARLSDGPPRVQAAALEGLVRHQLPAADLVDPAVRLLASPLLKARVNAILVLAIEAPDEAARPLGTLLTSSSAIHRLEAAFVLGYTAGARPAGILAEMAQTDPSPSVCVQAVRSLARQPIDRCLDRLLLLLRSEHPKIASLAAQVLAARRDAPPGRTLDGLDQAFGSIAHPRVRGGILSAMGTIASRQPGVPVPGCLADALADEDVPVLLGALDACCLLGERAWSPAVGGLLGHAHPRVAARAGVAAVLSGRLEGLATVDALLSFGREDEVLVGLESLLDLVVVMPAMLASMRAPELARLARSRIEATGPIAAVIASSPAAEHATVPIHPMASLPFRSTWAVEGRPAQPKDGRATNGLGGGGAAPVVLERGTLAGVRRFYEHQPRHPGRARPIAPEAIAQVSYMSDLPTAWDRLTAVVMSHRTAVLAPLVMVMALLAAGVLRPHLSGPGTPGSRTEGTSSGVMHLVVVAVGRKADCVSARGVRSPIKEGDEIRPGATIETGPASELALFDDEGDVVRLGSSSHLGIGSPGAAGASRSEAAQSLLEPAGDVLLDLRQLETVVIRLGSMRVVAHRPALSVHGLDEGRQVIVTAGEAIVSSPGESDRRVQIGNTFKAPGPNP